MDFLPIVSTTSPDDALALLLAIYVVFELNFPKNGRAIRFLYSIVFNDKRFLSNKMRCLIKEKNIEINVEKLGKTSDNTNLIFNNRTTVENDSQLSAQGNFNLSYTPVEELCPSNNQNLNVNTTINSIG